MNKKDNRVIYRLELEFLYKPKYIIPEQVEQAKEGFAKKIFDELREKYLLLNTKEKWMLITIKEKNK